jgi:membrane fusion protein (multidrug efflux system)
MHLRRLAHLLFAAALLLSACTPPPAVEPPDEFPVTTPRQTAVEHDREYVGEVQAIQRAEILARSSGHIEAVAVDEGASVKEGQLLFRLSAKDLQQEARKARAAVASAEAELKAAGLERESTKLLLDTKVVSPAEFALVDSKVQLLTAKLEEARAQLAQAEINLARSEIRAPFDGVVGRLTKKVGSMIHEGDALTTLTNTDEVFVYFRVSESEYLEHTKDTGSALGTTVGFLLANGEKYGATGTIDAVASEFDRATGTIAFRARFPNEQRLLKHGSSGRVVLRTSLENAITVPQAATFEVQDQLYLYVVDSDGTARARKLVPGLRLRDAFVVRSGIEPGERFIASGIQKVKDGDKIAVRVSSPPNPTSQL